MKDDFQDTASPDQPGEQSRTRTVTYVLIFIATGGIIGALLGGSLTWFLAIRYPATPGTARPLKILPSANIHANLSLALDDPLRDNSRGYRWQEIPSDSFGGSCQFIGGAYHVISQQYYVPCHTGLQASNFVFEAHMQIIQGHCGGLSLRDTTNIAHAYNFEVCQDGRYRFNRFDNFQDEETVASGFSEAIVTGLGQSNVITAVANGSTFDLYANGQMVDSVSDGAYSQGEFGVSAFLNTEAVYTNAKMWRL